VHLYARATSLVHNNEVDCGNFGAHVCVCQGVLKGTAEREIARRVDINKTDKLHKVERDTLTRTQRDEREV
jgi:hypothetical protein